LFPTELIVIVASDPRKPLPAWTKIISSFAACAAAIVWNGLLTVPFPLGAVELSAAFAGRTPAKTKNGSARKQLRANPFLLTQIRSGGGKPLPLSLISD
jgi:hypothetical protein